MGEELQYSVSGRKTLNDHYEAVSHHYQSKKEDLKISVDRSQKVLRSDQENLAVINKHLRNQRKNNPSILT